MRAARPGRRLPGAPLKAADVLERPRGEAPGAVPPVTAPPLRTEKETYGHDQALDAMLFAARRMGLRATDRQVALLLDVAERHLLPPKAAKEPFPHGTMRGYKRHGRRREPACEECREACRLDSIARRRRIRKGGRRRLQPCGTEAAYHRHLRNWEKPCLRCQEAHRIYGRDYRAARKAAAA